MLVRPEQPGDTAAIRGILAAAFPTDAEARLVEALRAAGRLPVSLVAEEDGRVVGHVAFSPVVIAGVGGGLGLAPLAVAPDVQRRGVGGRLVRDGLAAAARSGAGFVVVLGHPGYYQRVGFRRASDFGLA